MTASRTPPKMKANTAGSSGLRPRRQTVRANRTAVTAFKACLCKKARIDMPGTIGNRCATVSRRYRPLGLASVASLDALGRCAHLHPDLWRDRIQSACVLATLSDWRGGEERIRTMQNLVEKFTPAVETTDDEGVVAIEYVVTAAAIVAALAGLFALGLGGILTGKLQDVVDSF